MGAVPWPRERSEKVRELWRAGKSARQIADEMGGITRNMVIGKIHRLGLAGQGARKVGQHEPPGQRAEHLTKPRRPYVRALVRPEPTLPKPIEFAREPLHLTIYQLRNATEGQAGTCKYPFGEAVPYTFCGHPTEPLRPYCTHHRYLCNPSTRST